jgi:hypothetical protein
MNTRPILKEIFLTPAFGALILPISFLLFLQWSWTRESLWRPYGDRGKSYESFERANSTFKVRATAYYEEGVYMPGAYFAFQSSSAGLDDWKEFAVFRTDDAIPIPHENLRLVSEQIAYVYMTDGYFVTVDGGRSWSKWKPALPPPIGEGVYWAIKALNVEPDGSGTANLWKYDEGVKDIVTLEVRTGDYGRHWSAVQSAAKHNKALQLTAR